MSGQLLVVTHLGQVLVFDGHRGTSSGTPLDPWSPVWTRPIRRAGWAIAGRPGRGAGGCRAGILTSGGPRGARGCGARDRARPMLMGLRYHPGEKTLLTQEWTSTRRGPRTAGRPGAVRRRFDGGHVNGRDQESLGTQLRRRLAEMVGAAGLSGADPAIGVAGWPDRGRRRARRPSLTAVRDAEDHGRGDLDP